MIPGFLLTVAFNSGILKSLLSLVSMGALQVLFGLEFIMVNKEAYFQMSYNFDRVFLKVEQVNFQFLNEELMHSDGFNKFLLMGHLSFLLIFLFFKWTSGIFDLPQVLREVGVLPISNIFTDLFSLQRPCKQDQYLNTLIMFTSNFIGMIFSRGTHQQFYSWYSYSFPFLVDAVCGSQFPLSQLGLVLSLETAWSVAKPRVPSQSYLLNFAHFFILFGLLA